MSAAKEVVPAGVPARLESFGTLADVERAIAEVDVGYQVTAQAVIDVEEFQLWSQGGYEDFEAWCWDVHRWKRSRASQLRNAGLFVRYLGTDHPDEPVPPSEKVCRAMGRIKRKKSASPPFEWLEEEADWRRRQFIGWQLVQSEAEQRGVAITADLAREVIDDNFNRGSKKKNKPAIKETGIADFTSAFLTLTQVSPEDAVERFGYPASWPQWNAFRDWAEAMLAIDDNTPLTSDKQLDIEG